MYDKEVLTQQLNKGLATLTGDEKLALILFYFEELNESEIAMVLDKSYADTDMILCQAKTKMRAFTNIFDDIDKQGKVGLNIMLGR